MKFPYTHEIERGDTLLEITGEYLVNPFVEATYWQPAEGGDIELLSVKFEGKDFDLTDAEESKLVDVLQEQSASDCEDAAGDYADYRYQAWKDDQMMDDPWDRAS